MLVCDSEVHISAARKICLPRTHSELATCALLLLFIYKSQPADLQCNLEGRCMGYNVSLVICQALGFLQGPWNLKQSGFCGILSKSLCAEGRPKTCAKDMHRSTMQIKPWYTTLHKILFYFFVQNVYQRRQPSPIDLRKQSPKCHTLINCWLSWTCSRQLP